MYRKYLPIILVISLLCCCLFSACQSTPEDAIVSQKGDLTDKIAETADPEQAPTGVGNHYSLEKIFNQSGHTLIVDADITGGDESKMAVLTVDAKPFQSGDSLKNIVLGLFPEYTVYDFSEFTKEDLKQQIEEAELMLFRIRNGLNSWTGEPLKENEQQIVPWPKSLQVPIENEESTQQFSDVELAELYLKELQEEYASAPNDVDLKPANYIIEVPEDSTLPQNQLLAKKGDMVYNISFVNRPEGEKGSYLEVKKRSDMFSTTYTLPKTATNISDLKNQKEIEKVVKILQNMGIDYMELYEVYQGEDVCQYIFTRSYNNAQEDYVGAYIGLTQTDGEGLVAQSLWKPEFFSIIMKEGEIEEIRWENPSQIVKVDNENVKILPWSEIQKIFEKQMEFLLTPSSEGGDSMFWWKPSDIKIERITLGLAKMLMKDSGEYKLIPVWNFFGRDNSNSDMEDAEEKCYVTINALDGTIMDRNVMY